LVCYGTGIKELLFCNKFRIKIVLLCKLFLSRVVQKNISKPKKSSELPKVSSKFLKENQTCKTNSESRKKKGGPYSRTERQKRRDEVYRLHFDYGYSALKISELMKINRNTINGDIQYWRVKVVKNWKKDSSPEILVIYHIERLELQRTRLREHLNKSQNHQEKLAIEKMILDVESKIGQTELKLCNTVENVQKLSIRWLNEWMKKNMQDDRFISYGDIKRVSGKTYEKICYLLDNQWSRSISESQRIRSLSN